MSQITTATADVPRYGVHAICPAATGCPHTIVGRDVTETRSMLADHLHIAHGLVVLPEELHV